MGREYKVAYGKKMGECERMCGQREVCECREERDRMRDLEWGRGYIGEKEKVREERERERMERRCRALKSPTKGCSAKSMMRFGGYIFYSIYKPHVNTIDLVHSVLFI